MDSERAFELYKVLRQESATWLGSHYRQSQQYLTLILAIMGAIFVAATSLDALDPALRVMVCIAPVMNAAFGALGIETCDRAYRVYLECLCMQAKIEPIVGLMAARKKPKGADDTEFPFPEDRDLLPKRWLQNRTRYLKSEESVNVGMGEGANRTTRLTFFILGFMNVILAIGIGWLATQRH